MTNGKTNSQLFIKAITSGYIYFIANLVVGIWLVPYVLKFLNKVEYGVFAILTDLIAWLAISNLGITSTFNSKGSQLLGSKSFLSLNKLFNTTFFIQLFSSLFIVLFSLIFLLNPSLFLDLGSEYGNVNGVIFIMILSYLISFILQPLNSLLIAAKQAHVDNYLKFGLLIIKTALTIFLLNIGFKLTALAISTLVATIVISTITIYRVWTKFDFIKISLRYFDKSQVRFLLVNGIYFTIGGIAGLLIFKLDLILISKFITLELVASFIITIKLYQIADSLHQQLFNNLRPYFAELIGNGRMNETKSLFMLTNFSSFIVAFLAGIFIFIINSWFISKWVGESYYLGEKINLLLCLNFIVQASVLPHRILLATALYRNDIHALIRILEGLFKIGLCFVFVSIFDLMVLLKIGILCSVIFSNLFLGILTNKYLEIDFRENLAFFLILLTTCVIAFISNPFIQISFFILTMLMVVWFSIKSFKQNKDLIIKIYSNLYDKFSKA
jgi:O-antigen/teichoic acid export membrane protein